MKTVEKLAKECGLIHPDWPNESGSKRIYEHELEQFAQAYMQDRLESLAPVGYLADSGDFFYLPPKTLVSVSHEELIKSINEQGAKVYDISSLKESE